VRAGLAPDRRIGSAGAQSPTRGCRRILNLACVERFTSYCAVGDHRVAYQVVGDEGADILYLTGVLSQVDVRWLSTSYASFLAGLGSFARVITLDRRGTGASDRPPPGDPSVDHLDDVVAVLDAVGAPRVVGVGIFDAVPLLLRFAAQHPDRVASLVLWSPTARILVDENYPEGLSREDWDAMVARIADGWGRDDAEGTIARTPEERRWAVQMQRAACSPAEVRHVYDSVLRRIDVRSLVPNVQCPVLILRRPAATHALTAQATWLLEHLPDAREVALPGASQMLHEESEPVIDVLRELVEQGHQSQRRGDRRVTTVVFVDIVGSTELARRLGDRHWTQVLERHDAWVAEVARRFGGRVINRTGDGTLLSFEGPAAAIASGLRLAAGDPSSTQLNVRVGIHTGEVEARGGDLAGLAVHVGARVGAAAGPGEVLVSRTVRDLVAGSTLRFDSRGTHVLKGLGESWELYCVEARTILR